MQQIWGTAQGGTDPGGEERGVTELVKTHHSRDKGSWGGNGRVHFKFMLGILSTETEENAVVLTKFYHKFSLCSEQYLHYHCRVKVLDSKVTHLKEFTEDLMVVIV